VTCTPYADLGADYFTRRRPPETRARKSLNDLKSIG